MLTMSIVRSIQASMARLQLQEVTFAVRYCGSEIDLQNPYADKKIPPLYLHCCTVVHTVIDLLYC